MLKLCIHNLQPTPSKGAYNWLLDKYMAKVDYNKDKFNQGIKFQQKAL